MAALKFLQDNIILAVLNGVETQQPKSCVGGIAEWFSDELLGPACTPWEASGQPSPNTESEDTKYHHFVIAIDAVGRKRY